MSYHQKNLKLLFITNNFPSIVDGVGDYTYHLANEFVRNRHEIMVICSAKSEIIEFVEKNALNIKIYPIVKKWNIQGIYTVYKQVKKLQPDWVLLQYVPHGFSKYGINYYLLFLWIILKVMHHSTSITFHEFAYNPSSLNLNTVISLAQKLLSKALAFCCCKIIVSNRITQHNQFRTSNKVVVIPSGSNIPVKESSVTANDVNSFRSEKIVISSFGMGLRYANKLAMLVERLSKNGLAIKLLLIGKLSNQDKFKERYPNTFITGYLKPESVSKYLSSSDIFILPMEVDSRGRGGVSTKSGSVAAALAHGLPIITTEGEMTDKSYFKHLENIYLVPYDWEKLYQAIYELYYDDSLRRKISEKAKKTYAQAFSWKSIYNAYLNHLTNGKNINCYN